MRTLGALSLAVLMVGAAGAAPEDAVTAAVEVTTLDRAKVEGALVGLGPDGVRVATTSGARTFAPDQVRSVRRVGPRTEDAGARPTLRVTLVGGDVRQGRFGGPAPDAFVLDDVAAGPWTVPFESVRTIEALPEDGDPCADPAGRHRRQADTDKIYLRSGDAYAGVVTAAGTDGLHLQTDRGSTRTVAWSELLVAFVDNPVLAPPPAGALGAEVETVDGGRFLAVEFPRWDADRLVFALRAPEKTEIRVPWRAVRAVRPRGPRFSFASDLPFEGTRYDYYGEDGAGKRLLDDWQAPRVDRRPTGSGGCPLRLGGVEYAHGFGVHAKTRIALQLGKAWRSFDARAGVHDEPQAEPGGALGVVDLRVIGDGRTLWESRGVREGQPPKDVGPLDVSNVEELVLETDYGPELPVRQRVDWVDPVLVRK